MWTRVRAVPFLQDVAAFPATLTDAGTADRYKRLALDIFESALHPDIPVTVSVKVLPAVRRAAARSAGSST
jgi:hypothetical protein